MQTLYAIGKNENNQCGLCSTDTKEQEYSEWTKVERSPKIIAQIATSDTLSMILLKDGIVYGAGKSENGALGLGENITQSESFTQIPIKAQIKQIEVGCHFCVAVDMQYKVWSWGLNNYGQCGQGHTKSIWVPTPIRSISSIDSISVGWYHSLALTTDQKVCSFLLSFMCSWYVWLFQKVFAFGCNDDYQCGQEQKENILRPSLINALKQKKITRIVAGPHHNYAVSNKKSYYFWGKNGANQCLKNKHVESIQCPTKLFKDSGDRIKCILLGHSSTQILLSSHKSSAKSKDKAINGLNAFVMKLGDNHDCKDSESDSDDEGDCGEGKGAIVGAALEAYKNIQKHNGNDDELQLLIKQSRGRWPNGIVPYVIGDTVQKELRDMLMEAVEEFDLKTPVVWRPKEETDEHWALFEQAEEAFSQLGFEACGPHLIQLTYPYIPGSVYPFTKVSAMHEVN